MFFLSQITLLKWLTFLLRLLTVSLTVLLFWICFFLLTLVFGNLDHVVVLVSIDFLSNSKWDAPFQHIACDYSCADWDGLHDYLRDVPWEDIFKLAVYIPHCKYQVKPHSSLWC